MESSPQPICWEGNSQLAHAVAVPLGDAATSSSVGRAGRIGLNGWKFMGGQDRIMCSQLPRISWNRLVTHRARSAWHFRVYVDEHNRWGDAQRKCLQSDARQCARRGNLIWAESGGQILGG